MNTKQLLISLFTIMLTIYFSFNPFTDGIGIYKSTNWVATGAVILCVIATGIIFVYSARNKDANSRTDSRSK